MSQFVASFFRTRDASEPFNLPNIVLLYQCLRSLAPSLLCISVQGTQQHLVPATTCAAEQRASGVIL